MTPDLATAQLLDCSGQVSHTFVLDPDGTVRVELRDGRVVRVDPAARAVLTPGVHLPQAVVDHACQLRPW
jgi:hypothetical protein